MTTSSSEQARCTRISPSAILDNRLEGNDLEWALDHLKTCDVCRDRIEEFREIVVRVEQLPLAPLPPAIIRDAYTWAIPEELRTEPEFAIRGAAGSPPAEAGPEFARFELPAWERPIVKEPPAHQKLPPPAAEDRGAVPTERMAPPPPAPPPAPIPSLLALPSNLATSVHEVPVQSRPPAAAPSDDRPAGEPDAIGADDRHEAGVSTLTRVAVGLVAAICILLAGVLYMDGGLLTAFRSRPAPSHRPPPAASLKPSASATPSISPSPTASPSSAANVIATLGDGVSGAQVYQIRVGTQVPQFTRLVFDMHAQGFPTMVITQPDDLHLVVTFRNTTGAGVRTAGIHTVRVSAVEPAVQQGTDLVFTIDLARAVQVKAFTLPPSPPLQYRLVLDLY